MRRGEQNQRKGGQGAHIIVRIKAERQLFKDQNAFYLHSLRFHHLEILDSVFLQLSAELNMKGIWNFNFK